MRENLNNIFSNVNEWLKFAEAKNTALLIFSNAMILGILSVLIPQWDQAGVWLKIYFIQAIVFLVLSTVIVLLSFIPQVKIPLHLHVDEKSEKDNVLFFGSIQKYSAKEYIELLKTKMDITDDNNVKGFELDLAGQIIANSKICMNKFGVFSVGVWFVMTSIVTPALVLVVFALFKVYRRIKYGQW